MKLYLTLLVCGLLASSCTENIVRNTIIKSDDTLRNIKFSHNLQESNFMTDADTLKIMILDTNIEDYYKPLSRLVLVKGSLSSRITGSNNHTFEQINADLKIQVNPNNKYEIWIMNLQPTIDSTRSHSINNRFDYYWVDIFFSHINPYYLDVTQSVFVQSTIE